MTKFEKDTLFTLLGMYRKELEQHITEGAEDTQFLMGKRIDNIKVADIIERVRKVEAYLSMVD